MEIRKILIADGSEEFGSQLRGVLQGQYLVRMCHDGNSALEQLGSFEPDLLIVDLMLPELDGLSLLQTAAQKGSLPNVLALTRFVSGYVLSAVERLGVSYVMMKPCDLDAVLARVRDLAVAKQKTGVSQPDVRNSVSNLLITLRVPTKLKGYACAREAVLCLMRDPGMSITKELYPQVAKLCDGAPKQVERAIRGAIHAAWLNRDEAVWGTFFRPGLDGVIPKPSNAAFISRLADHLLLEMGGSAGEMLAGDQRSDRTG